MVKSVATSAECCIHNLTVGEILLCICGRLSAVS